MKNLVLIAPLRLAGAVLCRIPGCKEPASANVEMYIGANDERSWDARSSGPFCGAHLSRMESSWSECDVRRLETTL